MTTLTGKLQIIFLFLQRSYLSSKNRTNFAVGHRPSGRPWIVMKKTTKKKGEHNEKKSVVIQQKNPIENGGSLSNGQS
jgi:hypothetical protein